MRKTKTIVRLDQETCITRLKQNTGLWTKETPNEAGQLRRGKVRWREESRREERKRKEREGRVRDNTAEPSTIF